MPTLTIIAGGNGVGKTSFATASGLIDDGMPYLNPDMVQRNYGLTVQRAARKMITFVDELLAGTADFAFETTLAGHRPLTLIERAKHAGWIVKLVYLGVSDVEIQLERIRNRVATGGHPIAEEDVRRRFGRSLESLKLAIPVCDGVTIFDNTTREPVALCSFDGGHVVWKRDDSPTWLNDILD